MHDEPACATRSPFQRDRDRVLHSAPFRRLTYKTQVFVYHEGDHYRTRLTHSLEVAQIARTIARQLRLDEDLAEVLALAHDLGHSPFGHAGERALDAVMKDYGGFDHNAQSLRIVCSLERKYLAFDGLNLTWETLEGLAKHNGPIVDDASHPVAKVARGLEHWRSFDLNRHASAEAQVAALADDIAYVNHDLDDGLRAGLIGVADLNGVPLAGVAAADVSGVHSGAEDQTIYEVKRRLITMMISDCVDETRLRLSALSPTGPDDIRNCEIPIVAFSGAMVEQIDDLKAFLFDRVYRHPRVWRVMGGAEKIVAELFELYFNDVTELPADWHETAARGTERALARLVADFVAGMTDRLALSEHRRLFDATPELR